MINLFPWLNFVIVVVIWILFLLFRFTFVVVLFYNFVNHYGVSMSQMTTDIFHFIRSFPHSWLITGFEAKVTRRVPHVEQELLTLQEQLRSPSVFSGFCCSIFGFLYDALYIVVCPFVLPRFAASDYLFGIVKLLLYCASESSISSVGTQLCLL